MGDITRLQDDIDELQSNFAEDLVSESVDSDTAEQLAMQSTLTVLSDRMATIQMKATGKHQLLEVYISFFILLLLLSVFCSVIRKFLRNCAPINDALAADGLIRVAVLCFRSV